MKTNNELIPKNNVFLKKLILKFGDKILFGVGGIFFIKVVLLIIFACFFFRNFWSFQGDFQKEWDKNEELFKQHKERFAEEKDTFDERHKEFQERFKQR